MFAAPSLLVMLALAAGIAIADLWALPAGLWAAAAILWLVAAARFARRDGCVIALACLCLTCTAACRATRLARLPWKTSWLKHCVGPAPVRARMRLVGPVQQVKADVGPCRWRARARLLAIAHKGLWRPQQGEVLVYLWPGEPVAAGDSIVVSAQLRAAPQPSNLGDLEARRWASRSGLSGRAQVQGAHIVEAYGPWYISGLDRYRQRCVARLDKALGPWAAAMARAMALGDAAGVPAQVRQTWADAGVAHLLAVSGLHLGLVMGLVAKVLQGLFLKSARVRERWHLQGICAAPAVVCGAFFVALSGGGWAAMRALCMATALRAGQLAGRRQTTLQILGLTASGFLWCWPEVLFDLGFQLSFAAVAGLSLWARPTRHAARLDEGAPKPQTLRRRVRDWLKDSLRVCAVAQLATAPLCAHFFGRIAMTAAAINLIAIPTAGVAVVLSLLCALWGPAASSLPAQMARLSLEMLQHLARMASAAPLASVWAPHSGICIYTATALLFAGLTLWRAGGTRACRLWARRGTFVALLAVFGAYAMAFAGPRGNARLQLDHLYVGQGDATLVTLPQGLTMLVDGGGATGGSASDPGRWAVAPALERRGIRRIDIMVLTHPHPDHLGGLLFVAERYGVGMLWLNGDGLDYRDVQRLIKSVQRGGGRVGPPPPHWQIQGVTLDSYLPLAGTWASANDHAVVLRLAYKQRSVLLAGDIEGRAEALLADVLAATDIIKVGHHGSRTSTSDTLLNALKPWGAVISCGAENQFGFPHAEVLDRLKAHDVAVWRTDTMGALHLETDGNSWRATDAARRRVWSKSRPKAGAGAPFTTQRRHRWWQNDASLRYLALGTTFEPPASVL